MLLFRETVRPRRYRFVSNNYHNQMFFKFGQGAVTDPVA